MGTATCQLEVAHCQGRDAVGPGGKPRGNTHTPAIGGEGSCPHVQRKNLAWSGEVAITLFWASLSTPHPVSTTVSSPLDSEAPGVLLKAVGVALPPHPPYGLSWPSRMDEAGDGTT